ncbi:TetR/AcrR family transcriptional regulator [Sphingobium nicotianae]|uniref:TetR/AcrR family transcriptional regulator n=1 Tax=Sphingobium nicotianae TaxID=2782607 RepID=A0A9X1ISB6_9SPHN|nr:TetR/AcrR family transcriptional regulator [Sphingobium nicotianae]MBT2188278.1 TetR/AcrR family transcriptional regulator [Sphingobium nicotianae]
MASTALPQAPKAPVQQRSETSRRRMVEGALQLLDERDIDQISVRDIVRAAGTSNGSFYHRFGTKEHFFNYLIDDMIARRERVAMIELSDAAIPFDRLPDMLSRSAIANFRQHAGLLRSAVRRHIAGDDCWLRISKMSRRVVKKYIERVAQTLGRDLDDDEAQRVYFAFVWLYGLLAYRTLGLNSIYGYTLPDELFELETIRNFRQLIDQALPAGTPHEKSVG